MECKWSSDKRNSTVPYFDQRVCIIARKTARDREINFPLLPPPPSPRAKQKTEERAFKSQIVRYLAGIMAV